MTVKQKTRPIPNTKEILAYLHCGLCIDSRPDGISHRDFASLEVGYTDIGLKIWCKRHEVNVFHIDFEGRKHPANTSLKRANIDAIQREET